MAAHAMSWLLSGALLAAAVAVGLMLRRRGSRRRQLAAMMPGPTPAPLLGNAAIVACRGGFMTMLSEHLKRYGDVVKLWMGQELNVMVADPDDLKLLLSSPKNSVKGSGYKYMADHLGEGLLSGSGHTWRRHRKIASPALGKRAVESYQGVFLQESLLLVERLRQETGRELNVFHQIARSTTYVVCQTMMSLSKEETMNLPQMHELINMMDRWIYDMYARTITWWLQFDLFYRFTDAYAFSQKFHERSRKFFGAILRHRNEALAAMDLSNGGRDDEEDSSDDTELGVVDRFILSNELNSEELISETLTIFLASQDASAKIASTILLMLAYHPEYQERLYCEILSVTGEGGLESAPLTPSALLRMNYLDCVFKESMRVFPIAALIQRTITEEFKISTHTLPAGCSLMGPIYQLCRDLRYWERGDDFYPDHFSPESVAARPANCFLPFSAGPMDCMGREYATRLVKQLVVCVVRQFRLTSNQAYKDMRLQLAISVGPKDGFKLILHPRK